MKKVVFILVGLLIGIVLTVGTKMVLDIDQSATVFPNNTGVCGQGSCLSDKAFYGNDVGDVSPNYTLTDFDGKEVKLYDLIEGYDKVIIALEADWCPDCHRQDAKMIQENAIPEKILYIPVFTTYSNPDGTKVGSREAAQKYVSGTYGKTDIKAYFDNNDTLWKDFEAVGTPTNITLDTNARIKGKTLEIDADTLMLNNNETVPKTIEEN